MGRIIQMANSTKHQQISGGHLFSGMNSLAETLVDIYVAAVSTHKDGKVTIECDFSFLDVRVKKLTARFFRAFSKLHAREDKCSITVIWTYDYQDEDILEFGEILEELTDIQFRFIQIDRTENFSDPKAIAQ